MIKVFSKVISLALVAVFLQTCLFVMPVEAAKKQESINKVRIVWESIPNAVMYELVVTKGKEVTADNILVRKTQISAVGYELDVSIYNMKQDEFFWHVRALDVNGKPISDYSAPQNLLNEEINPVKPKVTTHFNQLPYAKVYQVYSWIPVLKADNYEIQVFSDADNNPRTPDRLLQTYAVAGQSSFDYYDDMAYRRSGTYWWRIRAKNEKGNPVTSWSDPASFYVDDKKGGIAALGDSITHGGGAVSAPPSDPKYDWETYAEVPIRNLGLSGNTVEDMLNRFNDDVLTFKPNVLVVFGGINNIRCGDKASQVINGLNRIKYKCIFNNITPVFVTVAPVNPLNMKSVSGITVAEDWRNELQQVNNWIKQQQYHIDITRPLTDDWGWLKSSLAVDGLHPDITGKKMIGIAIGNYLQENLDQFIKKEE